MKRFIHKKYQVLSEVSPWMEAAAQASDSLVIAGPTACEQDIHLA